MEWPFSGDGMNRVMNALRYSVASYFHFAKPWVDAGSRAIADTIVHVAASHDQGVTRIGELLVERHGHAVSQTFPAAFTVLNDLSVRYALAVVIEDERQIIRLIEATAVELEGDAEAYDLAAELVDRERRHLYTLQRLLNDRRTTKSFAPLQTTPHAPIWPTAIDRPKVRTPRVREPVPELASR